MNHKKIFLILFLILSGFGIWGVSNYFVSNGSASIMSSFASGSFLSLDYIKEDSVFRQELQSIKNKIQTQSPNADLLAISMKFDDGLSYDYLESYNYIFGFTDESENEYLIISSSKTDKDLSQAYVEQDLFDGIKPSLWAEEYLKINFVQALEIVERAGGYNFRINHGGNYSANLLLIQPTGGVLNWYISYCDEVDNQEQDWVVNASTGTVQIE